MNPSSPAHRPIQTAYTAPRSTACIPCQKQKVRCILENGTAPCQRCQRRRVTCTFRKHVFQEDRQELGSALANDVKMIYQALNEMRRHESKPPLPPLQSSLLEPSDSDIRTPESPSRVNVDMAENMLIEDDPIPQTVSDDIDRTPINSLYQITRLKSLSSQRIAKDRPRNSRPQEHDIISKGLLEYSEAERLVQAYLTRSDHYLYGIAAKYQDAEGIRRASRLLLTAICTVSALQDASASHQYRVCHAELRKLISEFIFTPAVDLEDLRGLVITSFWLSDMSWTVLGLGIRRALEVELQSSFGVVLAGTPSDAGTPRASVSQNELDSASERMRLWYWLYICDQHLSILYARTPTIRGEESTRDFGSYLTAIPNSRCDQRLMSQVDLLRTLRSASDLFGVGGTKKIPPVFKTQMDSFNSQIDNWATTWLSCYLVGDYPAKAVSLHYHFAKLLICSHVFRGLKHDATVDPIPTEFHDTAQMAVQCAKSIVDLSIRDLDVKAAFVGLPHYFHSMIAYACAFLIKTITMYRGHIQVDVEQTRDIILQVIELCKTSQCGQHHLVHWIGQGLQTLLSNCLGVPRVNTTIEDQPVDLNWPLMATTPGGSQDLGQLQGSNGLRDPDLIWDAARQATFINPAERFAEQWDGDNSYSPLEYQFGGIPYPAEDFANAGVPLTGPQGHIEHYGLGLGLLR
ncbi:putative Zn(II)2Cys6 transcription factor [Dactylonectria macrodidyma]|uniref:Zn(II)2Cys6 transcription factor n=1 Tax=Dactylonectria macrodidyma TaxID=307937 RepID=A0A9P9EN04_9HYPO|nr:putative Zn(II)2Cys6 transcription factor [Dactylonectria macrodidyma]